jgi:hypothetical protein
MPGGQARGLAPDPRPGVSILVVPDCTYIQIYQRDPSVCSAPHGIGHRPRPTHTYLCARYEGRAGWLGPTPVKWWRALACLGPIPAAHGWLGC